MKAIVLSLSMLAFLVVLLSEGEPNGLFSLEKCGHGNTISQCYSAAGAEEAAEFARRQGYKVNGDGQVLMILQYRDSENLRKLSKAIASLGGRVDRSRAGLAKVYIPLEAIDQAEEILNGRGLRRPALISND